MFRASIDSTFTFGIDLKKSVKFRATGPSSKSATAIGKTCPLHKHFLQIRRLMLRFELRWRTFDNDFALVHQCHLIAELFNLEHVVAGKQNCDLVLLGGSFDFFL